MLWSHCVEIIFVSTYFENQSDGNNWQDKIDVNFDVWSRVWSHRQQSDAAREDVAFLFFPLKQVPTHSQKLTLY